MLVTTTPALEGQTIRSYHGIVGGEAVMGTNVFRDMFAGIRDIVGGRSASYEKELKTAKSLAVEQMLEEARAMGANAVVGVDLDYETVGEKGSMLMVVASGTAVTVG